MACKEVGQAWRRSRCATGRHRAITGGAVLMLGEEKEQVKVEVHSVMASGLEQEQKHASVVVHACNPSTWEVESGEF
jgi:hypothetical protein